MKFISQTPADDNGDYTMTFEDKNGNIIIKKLNLFEL
jgi:hypothetical protein